MRAHRLGLTIALSLLVVVGCGGVTPAASGTSVPASDAAPQPSASTAPSTAASAPAPSGGGSGVLSEACAEQVRTFLVAIEPLVANEDFLRMTPGAFDQFSQALAGPSGAFDPDLCPDMDSEAAHAAWIAIADEVAPGTFGYIDYIFLR